MIGQDASGVCRGVVRASAGAWGGPSNGQILKHRGGCGSSERVARPISCMDWTLGGARIVSSGGKADRGEAKFLIMILIRIWRR